MSGLSESFKETIYKLLIVFLVSMTLYAIIAFFSLYSVFSLIKAVFIIAVMYLYGVNILLIFSSKDFSILENLSVGIIFSSFIFLLLSMAGMINKWIFIVYYISPFIICIFTLRRHKRIENLSANIKEFFSSSTKWEFFIFLFPLLYSILPSSFYDTLVYHLGLPNFIIQYGGLVKAPYIVYFNTSVFYEFTLIPITYAGDLVPRIFHLLFSIIFIISLLNFSLKTFNLKRRILLLSLIISMPVSMFLITTIKNDIIGGIFIYLGIKHYYKNNKNISAVFWGFALGIKYFNLIPFSIFIFVILIKYNKFNYRETIKYLSISFLTVLPLLIKNIIYIGNPVYPFFYNFFKTIYWDFSREVVMRGDVGRIINSFSDFLKLPYNLSLKTFGYIGNIGIQFLIFLPFLLLIKIKNKRILLFSFITLYIGSLFTGSIRFFYIVFVFLAIYIVYIVESIDKHILYYFLIIIVFVNSAHSIMFQETMYIPHKFYSGSLDINTYSKKLFPAFKGFEFINNNTDKNAKILIIGENRNFYLKRKYIVSSALDFSILNYYLSDRDNFEKFKQRLLRDNIDYIFFSKNELMRTNNIYMRIKNQLLQKAIMYLNSFPVVFKEDEIFIYKIK